ncbi:condensation domain-containing protein [Streptomyces barringtoniae]|uniref:condensation domain-containing protein n=1 Tax=Streptomyces barringtoniae TaxID=2892029 RepID=UPI001E6158DF|nr:condensation domain-containing protein [Streptomyces barringtoniae]MCC5480885.1 condensation domain-containing protein [Streptomyces barringtoniae]
MNDVRPVGVCAVIDPERGAHGTLELHGPLETACFHRALHRIAEIRPGVRHPEPRLLRHGPDLHTVELPGGTAAPAPYPVGLLADLLTAAPEPGHDGRPGAGPLAGPAGLPCGTLPRTEPVTPLQQQRLAEALAWPDHQVEQVVWRWYGPLDTARFEAAWRAVGAHESVLRTGFIWDPRPRAVVFDRGPLDVVRHRHGTVIRRAVLLARERARLFDLRRPGPLRVALLESGPADAAAPFTDVLLTYHRALLDGWSVRLLMRECCRAYLADGVLPGGERRPDLGDCARWYGARDLAPADDFWRRPAHRPAASTPTLPVPAPPAGSGGTGVHRTALSPAESAHLARWAAHWGVAESSVLQAVWAMLLYRASGAAPRPAVVGFGLDFPGRGLLLEGIEGIPGPFENALPVTVAVDAGLGLPGLLRELRDRVLDMAAYEGIAAGAPDPGHGGGPRAGGLLAFDCGPRPEEGYGDTLAAHGIHLEEQEAAGSPAGYALRLRAGHDARRALTLTCVYDRGLVDDGAARTLLAHTVRLLRLLPDAATEATTVGDVLARLPDAVTPRVPDGPAAPDTAPLASLRGATAPTAATVCLVDVPGAPRTGHWELVRHYHGPEALTSLRLTAGEDTDPAVALGRLARSPGRLVLGGYSGSGALACELARHVTGPGTRTPLVVVGGAGDDPDGPRGLARALQRASAPPARS